MQFAKLRIKVFVEKCTHVIWSFIITIEVWFHILILFNLAIISVLQYVFLPILHNFLISIAHIAQTLPGSTGFHCSQAGLPWIHTAYSSCVSCPALFRDESCGDRLGRGRRCSRIRPDFGQTGVGYSLESHGGLPYMLCSSSPRWSSHGSGQSHRHNRQTTEPVRGGYWNGPNRHAKWYGAVPEQWEYPSASYNPIQLRICSL